MAAFHALDPVDPIAFEQLRRSAPPARAGTPTPARPRLLEARVETDPVRPHEVLTEPPPVRAAPLPPPFRPSRPTVSLVPRLLEPPPSAEPVPGFDTPLLAPPRQATPPRPLPAVPEPLAFDDTDESWFSDATLDVPPPRVAGPPALPAFALAVVGVGAVLGVSTLALAGALVALVAS